MEPTTRPNAAELPPAPDERSLGELFRALSRDGAVLVREEVALAKAEMRRSARQLTSDAAMVALGGAIAGVGALVLLAALVAGLGELMGDAYWLAALIVGAVLLALGGGILAAGISKARHARLRPEETIDSLRTTTRWARAEVSEFRSVLTGNGTRAPGGGDTDHTVIRVTRTPPAATGHEESSGAKPSASQPLWKRVWSEFKDDDIPGQGAKMAYFFFLSFPPAMMAFFALAGAFGGQQLADWLTRQLEGALPQEAGALVQRFVEQTVQGNAPGPLSVGLLLALWAGSNVFVALADSLNQAYDVKRERSYVKKRAIALGMLLASGILFLGGSALLLAGPEIASAVGLGTVGVVLQAAVAFLVIAATFWLIYYVLPNRDQSGCKGTLFKAASIVAAIWLVATFAFRIYVANFASYSETYGILGVIIVILLWMYLTSVVILLGGEIASEMERSAA